MRAPLAVPKFIVCLPSHWDFETFKQIRRGSEFPERGFRVNCRPKEVGISTRVNFPSNKILPKTDSVFMQNFCTRKNLGTKNVEAKDFEIEKLEINVLA